MPKNCILYGPEWESISSIACLPFIDNGIQQYKAELNRIGVITELKDGLGFVAECLNFPFDASNISPESMFSLLERILLLMRYSKFTIEGDFRKRLFEFHYKLWSSFHGNGVDSFIIHSSIE